MSLRVKKWWVVGVAAAVVILVSSVFWIHPAAEAPQRQVPVPVEALPADLDLAPRSRSSDPLESGEALQAWWDRQPEGAAVLMAPQTMRLKTRYVATLQVAAGSAPPAITVATGGQDGPPGAAEDEVALGTIKVTPQMSARLLGNAFDILPLSPSAMSIPEGGATWRWEVVPTRSGKQPLYVVIDALVPTQAENAPPVSLHAGELTIEVNVTWFRAAKMLAKQHAKWLLTALVIPL